MFNITNEKMYMIGIVAIILFIVGYFIDWYIKNTIRHELIRIEKRKLKKMKYMNQKQQKLQRSSQQTDEDQQDIDSYAEPMIGQYDENYVQQRGERLSPNDMGQRDLLDV